MNETLSSIERSGIRAISEYGINKFGNDITFLGFGQPKDPPPDALVSELKYLSLTLKTIEYSKNRGLDEARCAVAKRYVQSNIKEDDVTITVGATSAIALTLCCLLNNGDEVLLPNPGYPIYHSLVKRFGGVPIYYGLREDNNFLPDADEIKSKVSNRTKIFIGNSPNNPTGSIISQQLWTEILNAIGDTWIISDEVYDSLDFIGQWSSPLLLRNNNTVCINSISKTYNLCGLRVGYMICTNNLFNEVVTKAQEMLVSCAPVIGQRLLVYALNNCECFPLIMRQRYHKRMLAVSNILDKHIPVRSSGGMYAWMKTPQCSTSHEWCINLLEKHKVLICPGSAFGSNGEHYARISLIASDTDLVNASQSIWETLNA